MVQLFKLLSLVSFCISCIGQPNAAAATCAVPQAVAATRQSEGHPVRTSENTAIITLPAENDQAALTQMAALIQQETGGKLFPMGEAIPPLTQVEFVFLGLSDELESRPTAMNRIFAHQQLSGKVVLPFILCDTNAPSTYFETFGDAQSGTHRILPTLSISKNELAPQGKAMVKGWLEGLSVSGYLA